MMQYRELGRTGWRVSTISFGAWAIGGTWGPVDDVESLRSLPRAVDLGVNLFDTADVYGDGRSERLLARLRRERREPIFIATKTGRRLDPHLAGGYDRPHLTAFVDRSLKNLAAESLDLLQLHCPPTDVYYRPEVFGILDDLTAAGKLRAYGVSVERVEEALKAIEYPHVQSVQIIFNMFRHRPAELFFEQAGKRQVGILARVPLASGLLTGKLGPASTFAADDHCSFNRRGESFDLGETVAPRHARPGRHVRRGRSPQLQSPGGILRSRRDVLGRRLSRRAAGRQRVAGCLPGRYELGPVRFAVDPDVRRRHLCHPRRQASGAGRGKRLGRRPGCTLRRDDGSCARHLRPAYPRSGTSCMVARPAPAVGSRAGRAGNGRLIGLAEAMTTILVLSPSLRF